MNDVLGMEVGEALQHLLDDQGQGRLRQTITEVCGHQARGRGEAQQRHHYPQLLRHREGRQVVDDVAVPELPYRADFLLRI